jgi:GNAT superfamily N-acetyltransferase
MNWQVGEPTDEVDLDVLLSGTIAWPGADRVRAIFAAARGTCSRQFVVGLGDELVGYGHCLTAPLSDGGRAGVHVFVAPSARGQGIGCSLWRQLLAVARCAAVAGVQTFADVEDQRSCSIAAAHGLIEGPVRRESILELALLSDAAIEQAVGHVSDAGVSLALFGSGSEDARQRLYEDFLPLFGSTPDGVAGREPPPYETWRSGFTEPWQVLVARRGKTTVGMTMAFARKDLASRVVTFFTGVAAAERGKGIATALKAEHARLMRNAGWEHLSTWNMEGNVAILAANSKLGFVTTTRAVPLTFDFEPQADS